MAHGKINVAYRFWMGASLGSGLLASGIASGDFTVTVRDPTSTNTMASPTVTEVGVTGLYFFDVLAAFTLTNGAGPYGVHVEVNSAAPNSRGVIVDSVDFTTSDIDDLPTATGIADAVWDETIAGHSGVGSAGLELQNKSEPGDAMDLVADAVDATALATSGVNEIRDSILSDSTPFAGANIDAAITSRSSHSAADVDTVLTASHGAGSWQSATVDPTAVAVAVDVELTANHGAGSWVEATGFSTHSATDVADAVWDEAIAGHSGAGSSGLELQNKAEPGDEMDLITDAVDGNSVATSGANEVRDAILSDSTSFAGANVDATISSRATQTSVDAIRNAQVLTSTTAAAGTTSIEIRTSLTQVDDYFNGAFVQIIDGSDVSVRRIDTFTTLNGAIFLDPADPTPFTPSVGATVLILVQYNERFGG